MAFERVLQKEEAHSRMQPTPGRERKCLIDLYAFLVHLDANMKEHTPISYEVNYTSVQTLSTPNGLYFAYVKQGLPFREDDLGKNSLQTTLEI